MRDVTDDYSYVDPSSGPLNREDHLALMRRVVTAFPDRRITLLATGVGDDFEFGEGSQAAT